MSKRVSLLLCAAVFICLCGSESRAQGRKSVGAREVTGTFRRSFGGSFKGSYDEIKILALGGGKLRVFFGLIYPYRTPGGELSANVGEARGEAAIEGDTAVYSSEEFGDCRITIKFLRPGSIKVTQAGSDAACGFGHNVTADGNYRKVSGARPRFDQ